MKKIIIAIAALSAALSFTSCNKEEVLTGGSDIQPEAPVTVYATTGAMTKTSLSGNDTDGYQVLWSEGDEIIFVSKSSPAKKAVFTLTDGVGKTSGTFVPKDGQTPPEDGDYIVYYPATYDGTNWPASQTYVEGNISESPMKAEAKVSGGKIPDLKFQNAGGILRITVDKNAEVSINKISFYAKELSSPVVLNCSSVGLNSATAFHIAMPAKTYSEVQIFLTDSDDKTCCKSFKGTDGLVIERSKITTASFSVDKSKFVFLAAGYKLTINGHEGIVVDLGTTLGKVIVATMNVGATTVNGSKCLGDKMKYDEACAAWSGWRLPTVDELTAFCDPGYPACGDTYGAAGCTGAVMWDIDGDEEFDLYLPLNDYYFDGEYYFPSDKYWTGTTDDGGDTYYYFAPAIEYDGEYSPLEKIADNGGKGIIEETLDLKYIKDIVSEDYSSEKVVPIKGTITQISHSEKNFYLGCSNQTCRKKLTKKEGEENYVCPKCNTKSEKASYYYTLSLKVKDCSGEYWIDILDKPAETLIQYPAEEYKEFVLEKNQEKLKEISEGMEFKEFLFWVKPKPNSYGGNTKIRLYAYKIEALKDTHYSTLLKSVDKMIQGSSGY